MRRDAKQADLLLPVSFLVMGLGARRALRSWRARHLRTELVEPQLLALGTDQLKTEQEHTERFNGRASSLVGFAGVVLGLALTAGVETFPRLTSERAKPGDLNLGHVGEPAFVLLFVATVVLLTLSAGVAIFSFLPIKGSRLSIQALREFAQQRTPLPTVRARAYDVNINLLEAQRKANTSKAGRVKWAGWLFVAALLMAMLDACTLGVSQLNL
ncbi:MAG TPA: hypothetical protein VGN08_12775 [Solirubrobacteraceae bacterium]